MIRRMTIADYEKIFDLWKSTDGMGLRSLDDSWQGISAFLKRNPTTNFVSVDNGEITGAILCGHDGRRGYIYHTVVRKNYQNQGIGTKLIKAAISELQKEGITRVCLNVMETNEYGKSFWQKRGWEKKDFLVFTVSLSQTRKICLCLIVDEVRPAVSFSGSAPKIEPCSRAGIDAGGGGSMDGKAQIDQTGYFTEGKYFPEVEENSTFGKCFSFYSGKKILHILTHHNFQFRIPGIFFNWLSVAHIFK